MLLGSIYFRVCATIVLPARDTRCRSRSEILIGSGCLLGGSLHADKREALERGVGASFAMTAKSSGEFLDGVYDFGGGCGF